MAEDCPKRPQYFPGKPHDAPEIANNTGNNLLFTFLLPVLWISKGGYETAPRAPEVDQDRLKVSPKYPKMPPRSPRMGDLGGILGYSQVLKFPLPLTRTRLESTTGRESHIPR